MRDEEYDPTTCPAAGCDYEDSIRAVAAHISGTNDDRHSWENLVFEGARDFVMREKRRQRDGTGESPASDTESAEHDSTASSASSSSAQSSSASSPSTPSSTTSSSSASSSASSSSVSSPSGSDLADEPTELDLEFARDALLLLDIARRYDADSLDDLDTFRLVNLYTLLSDVYRGANDARKQVRDVLADLLQDDREVPSDFGSVRRYTSRRRNVKDEAVVRTELERAGIDPREAMSFDTKKLKQLAEERGLDEYAVFDFDERTYVKKSTKDADGSRRDAFERLDPEIRELVDEL